MTGSPEGLFADLYVIRVFRGPDLYRWLHNHNRRYLPLETVLVDPKRYTVSSSSPP
jgi:hypothetical protein